MLHYYSDEWIYADSGDRRVDICIYGGTASGVISGIAAIELGKKVLLLHPGKFLGGMTTGGLGLTDVGNKSVIGGLSLRFYETLGKLYAGAFGKGARVFRFEPKMATRALAGMIEESGLEVLTGCYLESLTRSPDGDISSISCRGGLTVHASRFIDATYEGDLMAAAGVPFTTGRESNAQYGETHNGFQLRPTHQFGCDLSPFRTPGAPNSGLVAGLISARFLSSADCANLSGRGDGLLQAYNFRLCMTNDPANRVAFAEPDGYEPTEYELAARWIAGLDDPEVLFAKFDMVTPTKTDTNNSGAFSTDFIGASREWPQSGYEERERIFQEHVRYQKGLHYFLAHDRRVPGAVRTRYDSWGLARDEFPETGGWPHQLYIREGRRMIADYVITEHDCMGDRACVDPVGMGAYNMDSHNCERLVVDGAVRNEGDVQIPLPKPYGISMRAILPPAKSCGNLVVPLALSASHIAFGSVRMEPVFMVLAESASTIAVLSMDEGCDVQEVRYRQLLPLLTRRRLVLSSGEENTGSVNPEDE